MSEQAKMLAEAQALGEELYAFSKDSSAPIVTVAAEILLAFRAVEARMPLQELMDNLLVNVPKMYAIAIQREADKPQITIAEG